MAWCRQATSHYLSQCCPRFMLPYGITRPQWANSLQPSDTIWKHRSTRTLAQVIDFAWQHQAITWTNVDLLSVRSDGIHLRAIPQRLLQISILNISLNITNSGLQSNRKSSKPITLWHYYKDSEWHFPFFFFNFLNTLYVFKTRERDIKLIGLFEDRGHRGPYSPYKLCNHNLYIGIIIFPHIDNPQSTGYN